MARAVVRARSEIISLPTINMIALTTPPPIYSHRNFSERNPAASTNPKTALHRAGECLQDEISQTTQQHFADLKAARRIKSSLRYMMAHLNEPMKISVLSAMVGLSESCFFAHFKNATGHPPVKLIIRARMRWASELLEETNLQIQEIAKRVGYEDQFYFSRLFKSVHGLSPQHYRTRKEATRSNTH
jgi:transcriptional regulator GlxA family with amidase domain